MPLAMKILYAILFLLPLIALLYFILGLPFLTLWKREEEEIEIREDDLAEIDLDR